MAIDPGVVKRTRFVCISDTHNQTPKLPRGDVLIHAGDLTNQGSFSELQKTVRWLEAADFERKIVIAGNHDITLDRQWFEKHQQCFRYKEPQDPEACLRLLSDSPSITYLNHESATIRLTGQDGPNTKFKIFGSPYSPAEGRWAFGYDPQEAANVWSDVPLDTDIVVSHTPPQGHCDKTSPGSLGGCKVLKQMLWKVRPKLAVCGHRHAGRGIELVRWQHNTTFSTNEAMDASIERWIDPGAGQGNKKESRIDLSSRSVRPLQNTDAWTTENTPDFKTKSSISSVEAHGGASSCPGIDQNQATSVETANTPQSDVCARLNYHDTNALGGRTGRSETCIVNASYMSTSYGAHKSFNKPIVVDLDLPVW